MRLRRVSTLVAAVAAVLLGVASPALANGGVYPPSTGGGGSGVEIWTHQTVVPVGVPFTVTLTNCSLPATLTISGPGRAPGVPPTPIQLSDPTQQSVTFTRVGRNIITASCSGASPVSVSVAVKANTPVKVTAASVLGETVQAGTTTTATAAGVGAAVSSGIVATLAHTGASLAPLWIALVLLLGGAGLMAVSRPRRRVAAAASGRHRG